MKIVIPDPEIIDDLLAENWDLRWQILELFHQVQRSTHNHARTSTERQQVLRLAKKLYKTLNGPSDRNLQLIITAAYFLGGFDFIFGLFSQLGIDDSDDFYPGLAKRKRGLIDSSGSKFNFFDYFLTLTSAETGVERTTAIAATLAISLFSPEKALQLITAIIDSELRSINLELLSETYPEYNFNESIFANQFALIKKSPELIHFILPPLSPEQSAECETITSAFLAQKDELEPAVAHAIARLQLKNCLPLLHRFADDNLIITTVRAQMGEPGYCQKLIAAGSSWQRRKRLAAISGMALIATVEAVTQLNNRARKGDRHERQAALTALAQNNHPQALNTLIQFLQESKSTHDRRLLLTLLVQQPQIQPSPIIANLLSQWHDQKKLYPELLKALSIFGYGDKWETIIENYKSPLLKLQQQKITLCMAHFAERPRIRKILIKFLDDVDWCFSFRLLTRLAPHCTGKEFQTLLLLLEKFEAGRTLTIQERLTKGKDITNFSAAIADFFNQNQATATTIINSFVSDLIGGSLPSIDMLYDNFMKQPDELKQLFLGSSTTIPAKSQFSWPLLHILRLLAKTEFEGCSSLATVVHRTRRYNGYFRTTISATLSEIMDRDPQFSQISSLSALQAAIEFMRQRPHYDDFREKVLQRITEITRKARELKIHSEATQTRSLRVISCNKIET